MPLEDVIARQPRRALPGHGDRRHGVFRVTRDADFEVSDEADDLLQAVEDELRRRRFGEVVRVEVDAGMTPAAARASSSRALEVEERQVYDVDGLLDLTDLWQLVEAPRLRRAARPAVAAGHPAAPAGRGGRAADVFAAMREGDLLVHHPYDSFATSVERFVEQAVDDPDVLAIKQTVYRTSDDSPLVPALIRRPSAASRRSAWWSSRRASTSARTSSGRARWRRRACTWSTATRRSRRTPSASSSCAARATACATTSTSAPATTTPTTARLYTDFGLFTVRRARSAPTSPTCSTSSPATRARARYRKVLVAPKHLRDGIIAEIERDDRGARSAASARGSR